MTLYHFTGRHHLDGIIREGITRGGIVKPCWFRSNAPVEVVRANPEAFVLYGWQWLTSDPSFGQGWATKRMICCDRAEIRLTVEVKPGHGRDAMPWNEKAREMGFTDEELRDFNAAGKSDGSPWIVYRGRIPPKWIRSVDLRPTE